MRPAVDQTTTSRVTVQEAAKLLGITVEAVRGRTKRGTLRSERDDDGTVYVFLDASDQSQAGRQPDDDQPKTTADRPDDQTPLVEALQRQLDEMNTANAELRRIIAGLVQKVPELEASSEPRDGSESAFPRSDRGTASEGSQEPSERRSWIVRFFWGP